MASDGDQSLPSTWQLAQSLGHLIPYVALLAFSTGILAPMSVYIGLNFFAQRHTDLRPDQIQCEKSMLTPYCTEAVLDSTSMLMLLSIVCPIVQFVMLPIVGVLADTVGRWKLVVASHVLGLMPAFASLGFVFFNTSMYWYYVFVPITVNPVTQISWGTIVFYSMVTDRVEQPAARSAGIGLLEAVMAVASVLGSLLGACLSLRAALTASVGTAVFALAYLILLMPETWPVEKRTRILTWRSLLPGVELSILFRSRALRLLSCIMMLTAMLDAGFARVFPIYLQWHMNWAARESYISSIAASIGIIISLGLIFRPLAVRLGDVGMLAVGRLASTITCIFAILVSSPWQVITVTFFSSGAIAFALPAVAGMKSSLVGPEDQGGMQGALSTIFNISSSVGVFIFGGLFNLMNRRLLHAPPEQQHDGIDKSSFVLGIVASLPVLWLIYMVPDAMKSSEFAAAKPLGTPEAHGNDLLEISKKPGVAGTGKERNGQYGSLA